VSPDRPIETERLELRPVAVEDLDGLYAINRGVEVARYILGHEWR
jgi:hypothetical protein